MPFQERMSGIGSGFSKAVGWSRDRLHERWNYAHYGFAKGKAPLERTHQLLSKAGLDGEELRELLNLTVDSPGIGGSLLQVRMAEKYTQGVRELALIRRAPSANPQKPE